MAFKNIFALLLTISCIMGAITASTNKLPFRPGHNLKARLDGEGGGSTGDCWSALWQLKSCTNEIVTFFMDGETTDLGTDCCRAIRIISHYCWPSMFTSLGFTTQEGDILNGYCDATSASPAGPVQTPLQSPPGLA
ncbi:hypothetical protein IFM89_018507 [Coptis chinensis]|uniref:Prolamin-like domain-containing protein n=1 Tax=Coptis chinensis TaxID=261450 RepID=A0A835ILS4_9MAGN|nr:hypothetical protein IFM89_018507 [Coptis chinensis]